MIIFLANQSCLTKLYFDYEIIRIAAKKTVVGVYKVMYTVHRENTLRIEATECINNEPLDWFWYIYTSRLHKVNNFTYFFKRYLKCILGVQIWCYIVRAQLLGERPKGTYSTAKQCKWPRGFEIVLKLGKWHLFRQIHTLNLFLLQTYSHLASETRTNLSTLHWWIDKNPLEPYWGDYLVTFNGVSQLKLVNETITSKAYQDNIKSDIKLQYECNIPQAFNKITHLKHSHVIHIGI